MTCAPISFYIHRKFWPQGEIPSSPDVAWSGFNFGVYTWTIQTALRLQQAGLDCRLTSELPCEGIVLAHRECMAVEGERIRPGPQRLLINFAADLGPYTPANLQVVQNPVQARFFRHCYWIRHWPEPGLIPRAEARGDRFENVAYVGNEKSLAPELRGPEWAARLAGIGFRWIPKIGEFQYNDPSTYRIGGVWSDFSDIDVVCAVRRFLPRSARAAFDHKPPSKLINAWIAGVPAILGHESAFRALRRDALDYIEVCSVNELLQALVELRSRPELRAAMRDHGRARLPEVTAAATVKQWLQFIEEVAVPAYHKWIRVPGWLRRTTAAGNEVVYQALRVRRKLIVG